MERADGLTASGRQIAYRDVATFAVTTSAERDWGGQLLCAAVYGMGSALILLAIMIGSLDYKFLIAVVFLAAICAMSLIDAFGAPRVVVYEVQLVDRQGAAARFVDADVRVVSAVAARLRAAGAREQ